MGKKILIVSLALFLAITFTPTARATKINQETVKVDLGRISHVEVKLDYQELTSQQISYSVPFAAWDIRARSEGNQLQCEKRKLEDEGGTEFLCTPPSQENFTVTLAYKTDTLTEKPGEIWQVSYDYYVLKPTENYQIRFILPEGKGIYESEKSHLPSPAQPAGWETGSEGRRIFLQWDNQPELSDKLSYTIYYEDLSVWEGKIYIYTLLGALMVALSSFAAYFYFKKSPKSLEGVLPLLKQDEKKVIKQIIKHGNSCEQSQIVSELEFSKAKVSRLVKDLSERNVISKEKIGRKNRITLEVEVGEVNL